MSDHPHRRGCLVTIEGIDGAGKSTQVARLADLLVARGYPVVTTREPGATPLGREVRRLLLETDLELSPPAELLLFLADRAEHVARVIRPALVAGKLVLCDRYADSTVAYQGYGRTADVARVRRWDTESRDGTATAIAISDSTWRFINACARASSRWPPRSRSACAASTRAVRWKR